MYYECHSALQLHGVQKNISASSIPLWLVELGKMPEVRCLPMMYAMSMYPYRGRIGVQLCLVNCRTIYKSESSIVYRLISTGTTCCDGYESTEDGKSCLRNNLLSL